MRIHSMRFLAAALILAALILTLAAGSVLSGESDSTGPETLILKGGARGDVPLPHRKHQDNLQDCKICHGLFPQKAGGIAAMKADGQLRNKQVMNKLCLSCHRNLKRAGKDTGPTTCNGCHQK